MAKELDLLKQDPYISDILKKNNLSDDLVNNNINKFLRVYNSRKLCNGCKGLYVCSQASKGERLDIKYEGVVIEEIEYCDYALAILKRSQLSKSYVYCDVPDNLIDVTLDKVECDGEQLKLLGKLGQILKNKSNKGLYISGSLGVGKTYLCIALANSLVKNKEKVAFVKVANFFNDMKSYISTKNEMIDININKLKTVKYLFLDDIGAEAVSEFVRDDILFGILDYRLENNLTTIFTSNLNKDELKKHYTYDRKDKANLMNAERLLERIDILSEDFVLEGKNMRRE